MTHDRQRLLFVTGRFAEHAVRAAVSDAAALVGFDYEVVVLPITVAALMHADWVRRKLRVDGAYDRVLLPGWCQGDIGELTSAYGMPFERGPKDVRDLREYLGGGEAPAADLSRYDIEILAEINHAPRLSDHAILEAARRYRESGADVIDLGCIPGEAWPRSGDVTRLLRSEGFRVSIDSFERTEVEAAVGAGAELVLSANAANRDWLARLGAEVVAIPDDHLDLTTLQDTIDLLQERGTPFRIDPVIEPIGYGFAASLGRYYEARRRWPGCAVMMGVGNITEMTEVDSAGVNVLLAAVCQELGIRSVLTTEVITWAQSAVMEFNRARRLVKHAIDRRTLAKHAGAGLVMLRDERVREFGAAELESLAGRLTDPNYRIFVERGEIHVMNRDGYWRGNDPFELYEQLAAAAPPLEPSHAFYLGYELSKAMTSLTLGKQYTQDEALQWGMLTVPEPSALDRRHAGRKSEPEA